MIKKCEKCNTLYNNQTVKYCPKCNYKKQVAEEYETIAEFSKNKDITSFRRDTLNSIKKTVNSLRSNLRTQFETKTGKQIGGHNVK